MEYVYGAMLLHSAGQEVNEANVEKVLTAGGVKVDAARVKALVASLEGVDIEDAIKTAAQVAAPPAAAAAPEAGAKEKPKEEKKDEGKSEEDAASGLASLFG